MAHHAIEIVEWNDAAIRTGTAGSGAGAIANCSRWYELARRLRSKERGIWSCGVTPEAGEAVIVKLNNSAVETDTTGSNSTVNDAFTLQVDEFRRLQEEAPSGFSGVTPKAREPEIEVLNNVAVRTDEVRRLQEEAASGFSGVTPKARESEIEELKAVRTDEVRRLQEEAPNGFSGVTPKARESEIEELNNVAVRTNEAGSDARKNGVSSSWNDEVRRILEEASSGFLAGTSPHNIFRIPGAFLGINPKAEEPEIVAIGPYHRSRPQVLPFEKLKELFLDRFLCRTQSNMEYLKKVVADEETSARSHYSEHVNLLSGDFVQMMLLDGCFVLELLLQSSTSGDPTEEDNPIFTHPQTILDLISDLLKLENQIPYSLLQSLFYASDSSKLIGETDSLATLALNLFNRAYPRPVAHLKSWGNLECEHLLDLFYLSLSPTSGIRPNCTKEKWLSAQSVPCATELRPSGIKFKSTKADNMLDISFRKRVFLIPHIPINDFMITVLINCVSLEQCRNNRSKYMTDYVSFMHCLINQPKDVSLLRKNGIITLFSHDDQYVANLFDKLAKSVSFNVHDCFLSEHFEDLEAYYHSKWANMMRTYFPGPRSFISAFSTFLVIILSFIQAIFSVIAFCFRR